MIPRTPCGVTSRPVGHVTQRAAFSYALRENAERRPHDAERPKVPPQEMSSMPKLVRSRTAVALLPALILLSPRRHLRAATSSPPT